MINVKIGDSVVVTMPYSEVCMYMRIAGKDMIVTALPYGMAAVSRIDSGGTFCPPITEGEAGIRTVADSCAVA